MSSPAGAVERLLADGKPRADAERNVRKLVDAARTAVAEVGVAVTAHEIARRAGVGIGTFYRRLPSREVLLEAVLSDTLTEILDLAAAALEEPDPWAGFRGFAASFVELRAASCGLNEALGGDSGLALDDLLAELRARIRQLVERAQSAGAMRVDVTWTDIPFVLASAMPGEHTIGLEPGNDQWRRTLRIVLDGLAATTPPHPG